jgi:hypothetical protein
MNVMCNGLEAEMLLDLANHVYPDIAPDIARHIARAQESYAPTNEEPEKLRKRFKCQNTKFTFIAPVVMASTAFS